MAWYIWMEGGRPHLGCGRSKKEAVENDLTRDGGTIDNVLRDLSPPLKPSSADENWLKSEIEKLEQERRNLGIPHDET